MLYVEGKIELVDKLNAPRNTIYNNNFVNIEYSTNLDTFIELLHIAVLHNLPQIGAKIL